jgi:hypothetical protein
MIWRGLASPPPYLLDLAVGVVVDALDVEPVFGLELGAGFRVPRLRQRGLVEDVLLRQPGLTGLAHLGDACLLILGEWRRLLAPLGVFLPEPGHGDLERALRGFVLVGHRPII